MGSGSTLTQVATASTSTNVWSSHISVADDVGNGILVSFRFTKKDIVMITFVGYFVLEELLKIKKGVYVRSCSFRVCER